MFHCAEFIGTSSGSAACSLPLPPPYQGHWPPENTLPAPPALHHHGTGHSCPVPWQLAKLNQSSARATCWSPAQSYPCIRCSAAPFSSQQWKQSSTCSANLFKAQVAPVWRGHCCFLKVNASAKVQEVLTHEWAVQDTALVPVLSRISKCGTYNRHPSSGWRAPGPCPPSHGPQAKGGHNSSPVQYLHFHSTTCSSSRISVPKKQRNSLNKWSKHSRLIISCKEQAQESTLAYHCTEIWPTSPACHWQALFFCLTCRVIPSKT